MKIEATRINPKNPPKITMDNAEAAAATMLDEKKGIGTFWSGSLPGRRAPMFSTHKKIKAWTRMEIGSENNVNYWADRCEVDFDCRITQGEKYIIDRMSRSELFLQRFATLDTWKLIEQGSQKFGTNPNTLYSLTELRKKGINADATTWGDENFLNNINYIYLLSYMGRSRNVCGKTTYGWAKNKVKPNPTTDGQRNLVFIGSATDFYTTGVMMTHDLINPALHLFEALGQKGRVTVYTQVDIDNDCHAYEFSPWAPNEGKFKLAHYDYKGSRTWYRKYPVHAVAPSHYTRRVWWIKNKSAGLLYPFDPTTTIFTGENARDGMAYHCLWVWRMAYGAPFDIRRTSSRKQDLWDLINSTVRPQCMLPVKVELDRCKLPEKLYTRGPSMGLSKIKKEDLNIEACKTVMHPIFAYGCPKNFLGSTPKVLASGLPELIVKVIKTKKKYVLKWPNNAETIIQQS